MLIELLVVLLCFREEYEDTVTGTGDGRRMRNSKICQKDGKPLFMGSLKGFER